MSEAKIITTQDLICMNAYKDKHHYRVDLAYAHDNNLLFKERIYKKDAKLWLHKDLAKIVLQAATYCFETYNAHFILYDGLRTSTAQDAMMHTQRVRDNPHWLEEPRLLSPSGSGGHPRGMAIDIGLETAEGTLLDMGTAFDYLAENPHPEHNPAHREYNHSAEIIKNRNILDDCMIRAAQSLKAPLLPLPQEWWDYRLPPEIYEQYAPLSDTDLPEDMRLTDMKQ